LTFDNDLQKIKVHIGGSGLSSGVAEEQLGARARGAGLESASTDFIQSFKNVFLSRNLDQNIMTKISKARLQVDVPSRPARRGTFRYATGLLGLFF